MSSNARGFDQVELHVGDGAATEVFTRISSVDSFDGPTRSRAVYEKTTLYDAAKRKAGGILDNGQITLNLKSETADDEFTALQAAFEGNTPINLRIIDKAVAPNAYMQFAAIVSQIKTYGVAINQAVTCSVTLDIDGDITEGTVP